MPDVGVRRASHSRSVDIQPDLAILAVVGEGRGDLRKGDSVDAVSLAG